MLTSCSSSIGAIPAAVSLKTRIQGPLYRASADGLDVSGHSKVKCFIPGPTSRDEVRGRLIGAFKRGYEMFCVNMPQNDEQGLLTSLCLASALSRVVWRKLGRPFSVAQSIPFYPESRIKLTK